MRSDVQLRNGLGLFGMCSTALSAYGLLPVDQLVTATTLQLGNVLRTVTWGLQCCIGLPGDGTWQRMQWPWLSVLLMLRRGGALTP